MKKTQLLAIQTKLNAPKNQVNKFWGFNYRSCEDILMAVKPLLEETNTTLTISDSVEVLEGRFYIKATATLYDNETWEVISSTSAFAREQEDKKGMDPAQVTGAASSYARKYALNWLFCIDDNRDISRDPGRREHGFHAGPREGALRLRERAQGHHEDLRLSASLTFVNL